MLTHALELKKETPTYPPSAPMRLHPEAFKLPAQLTHTGDELKIFLKEIYKQEPEYKVLNSQSKFHETFKKQMQSLCNAFCQYAKEYGLDVIELSRITNYPAHLAGLVEGKPKASVDRIKLLLEELVYLIQKKKTADKTKIREALQKRAKEKKEPLDEKQVEAQYAIEVEEINVIELRKQLVLIMLIPQFGVCTGGELGNIDIALSFLRGDDSLEYTLCDLRMENYTDFEKRYIAFNPSIHEQAIHVPVVLRTYLNMKKFGILSKLDDFKDEYSHLTNITSAITSQLDSHLAETYQLRSMTDRILKKWLELFRKKTLGDAKEQAILDNWVPYNQKLINLANDILATWEIHLSDLVFDFDKKTSQLHFSSLRFKQLLWQFCQKKNKFVLQEDWQMTEDFLGKYRLFHPKDIRVLDLAWLENSEGNIVLISDLTTEEKQSYFIDSIANHGVPDRFHWLTPSPKLFDVLKTDDDYLVLATKLSRNKQWTKQIHVLSAILHERPHHFMSMLSAVGEEIAYEWLDQLEVDFYWTHPRHLNHSLAHDLIVKAKEKDLDFVLRVAIHFKNQQEKLRAFQDKYNITELPIPYNQLLELAKKINTDEQFIYKWYLKQYFPGAYYDVIAKKDYPDYAAKFLTAHQTDIHNLDDRRKQIRHYLQHGQIKPLQEMKTTIDELYNDFFWAYRCQQQSLLDYFYDQTIHMQEDSLQAPILFWMVAFNRQEMEHKDVEALLGVQDLNVNEATFNGRTPLHAASNMGLTHWVKTLCEFKSLDVDASCQEKITALMIAAEIGHLPIVQCLLAHNAQVNAATAVGKTALFAAAREGHLLIIECLLAHNAQVNTATMDGETALFVAAQNGHFPIVECLLKHKADANAARKDGAIALHVAAEKGYLPIIQCLLEHKVDANAALMNGATTLIIAAENNHLPIVQCLLEHKAHVNTARKDGTSALYIATQKGYLPIIECLLKHKADANTARKDGVTALYIAAEKGYLPIVQCLLGHKADVDTACQDGATALYIAVQNAHLSVVQYLLEHKADANAARKNGGTALYVAAQNGHLPIVQCLLAHNAQVNAAATDGTTALFIAADKGYLPIVQCLLEHKADADTARKNGATALIAAAYYGHIDVVKALLKANANPTLRWNNKTPAEFASDPHIKQLLLGAELNIAAKEGRLSTVEFLLKNMSDVDVASSDGATALHFAVRYGYIDIVKALLDANANTALRWNDKTPYEVASEPRIKRLLLAAGLKHEIKNKFIESKEPATKSKDSSIFQFFRSSLNLSQKLALLQQLLDETISTEKFLEQIPMPEFEFNKIPWVFFYREANGILNLSKIALPQALMIAVREDNFSIVKYLLEEYKVDVNVARTHSGDTALHLATQNGHLSIVRCLLEHKAEVNAVRMDGATALIVAAEHGDLSIVQCLLEEHKADVNTACTNGITALHNAAKEGHLSIVKCLLENKADVNATSRDNATALHFAVHHGHIDVVKALLNANANPTLRYNNKMSSQIASDPRIKKLLLIAEIKKLSTESKEHSTPQLITSSINLSQKLSLLQQLLEGIISTEQFLNEIPMPETEFNKAPLDYLYNEAASMLTLSKALRLHEFRLAVQNGDLSKVKSLLKEHKIDVNAARNDGGTALVIAAQECHLSIVQFLLEHKAEVNETCTDGTTALHIAAEQNQFLIVQCLLEHKADVNAVRHTDGATAFQVTSDPRIKQLLLSAKLKHEIKEPPAESKESSPFHFFRPPIYLPQKFLLLKQLIDGIISTESFLEIIPMPETVYNKAPWDYFYKEADEIFNISKAARSQARL